MQPLNLSLGGTVYPLSDLSQHNVRPEETVFAVSDSSRSVTPPRPVSVGSWRGICGETSVFLFPNPSGIPKTQKFITKLQKRQSSCLITTRRGRHRRGRVAESRRRELRRPR